MFVATTRQPRGGAPTVTTPSSRDFTSIEFEGEVDDLELPEPVEVNGLLMWRVGQVEILRAADRSRPEARV